MSTKRTHHSEEFKREVIRLSEHLQNTTNAAEQLGIATSLLYRWKRELAANGKKAFPGHGVLSHDEKIIRLRRELKRVTDERDFLKKTSMYFAKDSQ